MPDLATSFTISPSNDSTIAIEVWRTGLKRRKKHILFFDQFSGEMCFAENDPAAFRMTLTIDTRNVACRDAGLNERKRRKIAAYVRDIALAADTHPEIRFTANSIRAKALRGFVVEGVLRIRGAERAVKLNAVLGPVRKDSLQLDGDVTLRLSDFGLPRPSTMFGLVGTKDEALVRLLLWAMPLAETTAPAG